MAFSRHRAFPRIVLNEKTHVELISFDHKDRKKAIILNICEGGALLKTFVELRKRSFWMVKLFLVNGEKPLECKARVVHMQQVETMAQTLCLAGIRFHDLTPQDQLRIHHFLRTQPGYGTEFAENDHAVS